MSMIHPGEGGFWVGGRQKTWRIATIRYIRGGVVYIHSDWDTLKNRDIRFSKHPGAYHSGHPAAELPVST